MLALRIAVKILLRNEMEQKIETESPGRRKRPNLKQTYIILLTLIKQIEH